MKAPIYLDYNATTPLDPRVLEAMMPFLTTHYGNAASRTHLFGWQAEEAVKIARENIAAFIGAVPEEIVFTSGATESDNLALKGVAEMYASKGDHIISVATEHKAVLDTCTHLQRQGKRITLLGVDREGRIDLDQLRAALTEKTVLVSIMLANNESGTVQDLPTIAEIVHEAGSLLMSDATQAIGKLPVNVNELGVDLMAFTAHKIYGPKGVGALYVRRRNPRVRLIPGIHGGGHQRGMRSGTLNVTGIAGFGKAIEILSAEMATEVPRLAGLRDKLEAALMALPEVQRNGSLTDRLPNVSNLSFGHVDADALIMAMRGIAVSTGSACTSAAIEPSHVLAAMGIADDDAYASIRFSLGRMTTEAEVDFAITHVQEAIEKLRSQNPNWGN